MTEQDWTAYFSGLSWSDQASPAEKGKDKEPMDERAYFDNLSWGGETKTQPQTSRWSRAVSMAKESMDQPVPKMGLVPIAPRTQAIVDATKRLPELLHTDLGKTGGNLVKELVGFVPGMAQMAAETAAPLFQPGASIMRQGMDAAAAEKARQMGVEPQGGKSGGALGPIKNVVETALFAPIKIAQFLNNPKETLENDPLGVIAALGGSAGHAAMRKLSMGNLSKIDLTSAFKEAAAEAAPKFAELSKGLVHVASVWEDPRTPNFVVTHRGVAYESGRGPIEINQAGPATAPTYPEPTAKLPRLRKSKYLEAKGLGIEFVDREGNPISRADALRARPNAALEETAPGKKAMMPMAPPTTGGELIRQDEAPIKTKIKGTMPVYADEAAQLMQDAKTDISYGTITEKGSEVKRVYQNPIRVLEQKPSTKRLYDAWRAAEDTTAKEFTSQVAPQIKTWRKEIKASGGTKERVAAYAISEQEGGPSILAAMKMDRPELNPGEMKVYGEMRATLDSFWNRVNEARKMSGQEPLDYRKNYYTWARDLDALKELGVDLIHDNASVVAEKFIELQGTPFKYTSRTMKAIPVYLDLFRVYENYAKSALEAIHTTPVIAKGRALREPFKIDQNGKQVEWSLAKEAPEMDIYLDSWLNNIAGKKPTVSHQFMKPFARWAGKLNKNIGAFALSFNPRTIGIQFTSLVNTYAKTGERFLVEGILDNFMKSKRDLAYNKGNVMATRQYDIHAKEMLGDTARTKFGRAKEAVTDVGMWGIGKADAEVARISWLSFYNKAKKGLKLTEPEAINYANDWVIKTQASAQRGDVAPLQTTPVGKSMSLFQTFVINNWNFLSKEVFGFKNPAMKTPERIATVSRLLIGTALINELFEGQFGIPSPFPAPERAIYKGIKEGKPAEDIAFGVAKEMAEVVPVIGTPIKFSSAYSKKSIPPLADVISDIPKAVEGTVKAILGKKSLNPSDLETLGKILGIQGGATVIKYWRRRKSGMSHLDAIMGVRPEYRKADKSSAGW